MATPNSPPQSSSHSPPSNANSTLTYPHEAIPYSEEFTNTLMDAVMNPLPSEHGLRILAPDSVEDPVPGSSVRAQDIDPSSLPEIPLDSLPLPLDDPRRVYASHVPGVRLTHPGGWLEGGAGPTPYLSTLDATRAEQQSGFTRNFIAKHNIRTEGDLQRQLRREKNVQLEELRKQMRARQGAVEHNAKIDREIQRLVAQREMERRVEEKMRSAMKDKKADPE